jgi:hypothetical protein
MTMTGVRSSSAFSRLSGPCFGSLIGYFVAATSWRGYVTRSLIQYSSLQTLHMHSTWAIQLLGFANSLFRLSRLLAFRLYASRVPRPNHSRAAGP